MVDVSNRISTSGYLYDTAGNLTNTPNPGGMTAQYNAENEITTANGIGYTTTGRLRSSCLNRAERS